MDLNHLASRLDHIAPFHVMELAKMATRLEREGRSIIHMGIGEPDFTAPPPVVAAATRAMADGQLQYTAATGLPALRDAISDHYRQVYDLDIAPGRIIITAGASAALLIGAYELEHHLEIPYKVVINEAVELTKSFGGIDGHKYVNGVLDKLAARVRTVETGAARGA